MNLSEAEIALALSSILRSFVWHYQLDQLDRKLRFSAPTRWDSSWQDLADLAILRPLLSASTSYNFEHKMWTQMDYIDWLHYILVFVLPCWNWYGVFLHKDIPIFLPGPSWKVPVRCRAMSCCAVSGEFRFILFRKPGSQRESKGVVRRWRFNGFVVLLFWVGLFQTAKFAVLKRWIWSFSTCSRSRWTFFLTNFRRWTRAWICNLEQE